MKKLLALLLTAVMLLALVACGGNNTGNNAGNNTGNTSGENTGDTGDTGDSGAVDIQIGVICVHDENSGYDMAHIEGVTNACNELGISMDAASAPLTARRISFLDACMGIDLQSCVCVAWLLGVQRAAEPDGSDVHGGPQAVLFRLFDDAVPHANVGGRLLQLHRDALGDRHALDLAGLKDLHHNNMGIAHRPIIDDVFLAHQRMAFILQQVFLLRRS